MIKVEIRIKPADGSTSFKRANARIFNTGRGTESRGDYYAHFYIDDTMTHSAHVTGWPRLERSVWQLLAAALSAPNLLVAGDERIPEAE